MLCQYLFEEDNAVGRLSGPSLSLIGRVGSLEELLERASVECKMFNDFTTTHFLDFMKIQMDLKCGKNTIQILERLRVCSMLFHAIFWISRQNDFKLI